jgi:hypothetical protein
VALSLCRVFVEIREPLPQDWRITAVNRRSEMRTNKMKRSAGKRTIALALFATVGVTVVAGSALAGQLRGGPEMYRAALNPVPHAPAADAGSNVSGETKVWVTNGGTVKVRVKARGLSPNLPHAMHIHGKEAAGEIAMCPGADRRDDVVDDGLIETVEGLADYGGILVSFTTFGDTSPRSGLALERMPVAKQNGLLDYKRTFQIPANLASRLDELHVVVHGEDLNRDGSYGGRTTALGAPLEAELPVACGELERSR